MGKRNCGEGDEEVGKGNGSHEVVEFWTNRANKKEKERKTAKWKGHQYHILTALYIIWDFAFR
jgi:hypothetical protein